MADFNLLMESEETSARLIRFPSGAGSSGGGHFHCLLVQSPKLVRFPSAPPNRRQALLTRPPQGTKRFYMRGYDTGASLWVTWSSVGFARTNPAASTTTPPLVGALTAVHIELILPEE